MEHNSKYHKRVKITIVPISKYKIDQIQSLEYRSPKAQV